MQRSGHAWLCNPHCAFLGAECEQRRVPAAVQYSGGNKWSHDGPSCMVGVAPVPPRQAAGRPCAVPWPVPASPVPAMCVLQCMLMLPSQAGKWLLRLKWAQATDELVLGSPAPHWGSFHRPSDSARNCTNVALSCRSRELASPGPASRRKPGTWVLQHVQGPVRGG